MEYKSYDYTKMTAQEVFNAVVWHLKEQGRPCVSGEGDCVYRSPEGLQCAASIFIPLKDYFPGFESHDWSEVIKLGELSTMHVMLIQDLQGAHDEAGVDQSGTREARTLNEFWIELDANLEVVASRHNLTHEGF